MARAHSEDLVQFAGRCGQAGEELQGGPSDGVDTSQAAGSCMAWPHSLALTGNQKLLPTRKVSDGRGGSKVNRNRDLGEADGLERRKQAGKKLF